MSHVNVLNKEFSNLLYFESESRFNLDENSFQSPTSQQFLSIFRSLLQEIHPACLQKSHFYTMTYLDLLESIIMQNCAFIFNSI